MDFKQLVLSRYSCRNYLSKEVPEDLLTDLFEVCRYAPSASNRQPWEFLVITKPELLNKVQKSYHRDWFKTAPVVIVVLADLLEAWVRGDGKNHADIDVSIIIDHFTLAAAEKGLGTCWVCNFDVNMVKDIFNLDNDKELVALISVGYPATNEIPDKKRKGIEDFVHFNLHDD